MAGRRALELSQVDTFVKWLHQHDVQMEGVSVRPSATGGAGLWAEKDIEKGQLMLAVPRHLIITTRTSEQTEIGRLVLERCRDVRAVSSRASLTCYILSEIAKGSESKHAPYFPLLPKLQAFAWMPLTWKTEEFAGAKKHFAHEHAADWLLEEVNDIKQHVKNEYREIKKRLAPEFSCTFKDYLWVRLLVLTRTFGLKIDDVDQSSMVPLADMLNHSTTPTAHWTFNQEKQAFTLTAQRPIKLGDEIFISYGHKPNATLLAWYGFCVPGNPYDVAVFSLPDPSSSSSSSLWRLSPYYSLEATRDTFQHLREMYAAEHKQQQQHTVRGREAPSSKTRSNSVGASSRKEKKSEESNREEEESKRSVASRSAASSPTAKSAAGESAEQSIVPTCVDMEAWVLRRISDLCQKSLADHDPSAVSEKKVEAECEKAEESAEKEGEEEGEEEEGGEEGTVEEREHLGGARDYSKVHEAAQHAMRVLAEGEVRVRLFYVSLANAILPLCDESLPYDEVVKRAQGNQFLQSSFPARHYFKQVWAPLFKRRAAEKGANMIRALSSLLRKN